MDIRRSVQMSRRTRRRRAAMHTRGQSTLEYAVVIAVVVGALLTMGVYMKHVFAGRLRTSTEQIGEQFVPDAYRAASFLVETSSGLEEMHTGAAPASGQSRTDNRISVPIAGYGTVEPGIHTRRNSTNVEQTTDDQANETSLFQ